VFRTRQAARGHQRLTEVYGDQGYAFVNVTPGHQCQPGRKAGGSGLQVSKGPAVSIDSTSPAIPRPQVIRRELQLQEQQPFRARSCAAAQDACTASAFSGDVNITTRKAGTGRTLDLLVDVKERHGLLNSAGAGISRVKLLFNVRCRRSICSARPARRAQSRISAIVATSASTSPIRLHGHAGDRGLSLFQLAPAVRPVHPRRTGCAVRGFYPLPALGWKTWPGSRWRTRPVGLEYRIEEAEISHQLDRPPVEIQAPKQQPHQHI